MLIRGAPVDRLATLLDDYEKKKVSLSRVKEALDFDFWKTEYNQGVKQTKLVDRIVDREIGSSNLSFAKSPEDILIERERFSDIIKCLELIRSILGDKAFFILFENSVFGTPQVLLMKKYHYSKSGLSLLISRSKLKIVDFFDKYPSYKPLYRDCFESLVYKGVNIDRASKSIGVGFLFEHLKNVGYDGEWKTSKKTGVKRFVVKSKCMIPEYLEETSGCSDIICPICAKCKRRN